MRSLEKEMILEVISKGGIPLIPTHNKLSLPIINRMYKKMICEIKFDAIKTCGAVIIDGHHRYIGSIMAKVDLERVKSSKTSATIEYDWSKVEFVEEEWDTAEKIKRLNELDAQFNNIPLTRLIEITK